MITADKLRVLTTFGTDALILAIGPRSPVFKSAQFVGMTNGNQFCYQVSYDHALRQEELVTTKVFITYDPSVDRVTATLT